MKVVHNAPSSNGYNAYCLSKEIIDLSVADVWDEAKMEWDLDHIVQLDPTEDVGQTCLCSHHPIFELFLQCRCDCHFQGAFLSGMTADPCHQLRP